ncbi:MAG: Holliday junction resolvase RecU [Bacillota bacterium]|nr:Holliday junction resolvase RecU [Bacillota bacterium]
MKEGETLGFKGWDDYPDLRDDEKDPKRRMAGAMSREFGGMFENDIFAACDYYRLNRIAFIEKTPEPFTVIKKLASGRFEGHFQKAAQPDFKGTLNGRAVVFEAKFTNADRIEQSRVSPEQAFALDIHFQMGAICFVLVSMGFKVYRVPWQVWHSMKKIYGRVHMKKTDLERFPVKLASGMPLFLDGIGASEHEKTIF